MCKCAPGYELNSDGECVDIDECSANNLNFCDSVNGICSNYDGGYTCSCENGYKGNGITCEDEDECESGTDVCSKNAKCTNTDGSYTCVCNDNYSGNGFECIEDEPETCDPVCGNNSFCDSDLTCKCLPGFESDVINGDCTDIDECKTIKSPNSRLRQMTISGTLRLSQETCVDPNSDCLNLEGSFVCPCKAGYEGVNGTCVNIDECIENRHSCSENAICKDLDGLYSCECKNGFIGDGVICNEDPCDHCGDASCDANGKCECPTGFVFQDKTCVDIDECDRKDNPCNSNAACINTDGSYICNCFKGYVTNSDNTCADVDECAAGTHNCDPNASCSNYDGGYNCACGEGYNGNGLSCSDIDECELNLCGRNSICTNTIGDFECKCKDGFKKNQNGFCDSIEDPCETGNHDCKDNSECKVTRDPMTSHIDGFVCKCKSGYEEMESSPVQCRDIDECAQDTHNCNVDQKCINTDGSYECGCPSGFTGDGLTCDDIDECNDGTDSCAEHSTCVNTIGSYECDCNAGFDGETCSDVDECILGTHQCHENGTCHNNDGSYTCHCNENFEGDGVMKCDPIEECDPDIDPACDFHELTFGDPHFLFHQGDNQRICFNYDGSIDVPMLLVGDDVTGFYITGKLEKAGRGSAFREIRIMTPDGIVAVFDKNGIKEISGGLLNVAEGSSEVITGDLEVRKVKGSKNSWKVKVGSGIEIIIERRHVSTTIIGKFWKPHPKFFSKISAFPVMSQTDF